MPTLSTAPAASKKLSVNLSEEATEVVRNLAQERGVTVSEVIREAISLYRFLYTQLEDGAQVELARPDQGVRERVHFVFAP